ncbi:DUF1660 family phage protein [Citromicrobium bathyomarinum]|uniref:DUF1660 family phage protein n=1 Tax=Citromicrobium bathyomarinum TaxID=72174 RepID=UPI003CC918DD
MHWLLICRLFGHRIPRRKVWHDGADFRTTCTRCRRPLLKAETHWREFDTERDLAVSRNPHPNFHIERN